MLRSSLYRNKRNDTESNHNCIHRRECVVYFEPRRTLAAGDCASRESLRHFGNADRACRDRGGDDLRCCPQVRDPDTEHAGRQVARDHLAPALLPVHLRADGEARRRDVRVRHAVSAECRGGCPSKQARYYTRFSAARRTRPCTHQGAGILPYAK